MEALKQSWIDLDVKCLSLLTPAVVLVAWEVINVSFSFLNRQLLSPNGRNFNYIIFLSCWQQLFIFLLLSPIIACKFASASWEQLRRNIFGISMLALLWTLSALCTSAAQSFLGTAIIEVIKCCMPFPAILLSVIFERNRQGVPMTYPPSILGAVTVIVVGAALAVFDNSQSSALGYFLVIAATCMTACYYVAAGVLLKTSAGGLNAVNLSWYVSLLAIPLLLICFAASSEPRTLFHVLAGDGGELGWCSLSALGNLLFCLLTFALVGTTSALTTSIAESIKRVVMMLIAIGVTHSSYVAVNFIGVGLFVPGLIVYAHFVFMRRFEAPREPAPLEVGIGVAMKGKNEGSALLPDEAPAANVCCVVQ